MTVYLPAGLDRERRYPLVFVHDGGDYLTYGSMALVLDNLIHWKVIPPVIAAFSWPGDRLHEYAANPDHADFVVEEALPRIEQAYPISDRRLVMGASLGSRSGPPHGLEAQGPLTACCCSPARSPRPPGGGRPRPLLGPVADLLHHLEPSQLPRRGLSLLRHLRADDR